MKSLIAVSLSLSLILMTKMSYAECAEYKIIDNGDSVEALCVGQPLTEVEKKDLDKQKDKLNEQDKNNAILDCFASMNNYPDKVEKLRQEAICKKMAGGYGLQVYLALKAMKPAGRSNTTTSDDNSAGLAVMRGEMASQKAQMDAQRAAQQMETQRQQAEMQRLQQQQNFNKIWNK